MSFLSTYSAGGLVTAVAPVVVETEGLWVGWPGLHLEDALDEIPESDPDDHSPTAGLKSSQVKHELNQFYMKFDFTFFRSKR